MLQKGADGKDRLLIEAKFSAPLTSNQPVAYLKLLPANHTSALAFLAPSGRADRLWEELLQRVEAAGMKGRGLSSTTTSRCVKICGTPKHLLVTDWTTLLSEMEASLDAELDVFRSGLADLRQIQGLVEFANEEHAKAIQPGKGMVEAVTGLAKKSEWFHTKDLKAVPNGGDFGRYVRLGRLYRLGVWFGINSTLHEEFAATPLWIHCSKWSDDHHGLWNEGVASSLKAHANPYVKPEGEKLWVGVIPEDPDSIDSYAAVLERIAEILDGFAQPWRSPAGVLAEVRTCMTGP